jgi:ABC-type proline/glycine betaine transport system permease subunit
VVGTILSIALAIIADVGLTGVQRILTPWARRGLA